MSLMRQSSWRPAWSISRVYSARFSLVQSGRAESWFIPRMMFRGVRMSWLMLAKN